VSESLFTRALDLIGSSICTGAMPAGTVITVEQLIQKTGASRSIVREATRVLSSNGLLQARQNIGMRVLPASQWNVLDPRIIGWRLAGPDRSRQIDDLRELRSAIEPTAARLAAARRSSAQAQELVGFASQMATAANANDGQGFLHGDAAFHRTMLASSGNVAFIHLTAVIETVLIDRERTARDGARRDLVAIALHEELAEHIAGRRGAAAQDAMLHIVERTRPG
jgi:DNA-binding FadR family transcriptional regulator